MSQREKRSNPGLGLFLLQFVANIKVPNGHLCLVWVIKLFKYV